MARYIGTGITDWVEATAEDWMGLTINRDKTTLVNLREPKAVLHFLGYSYRYDKDLRGRNKRYLNQFPSKEACARRREKVRQQLNPQTAYAPIPKLIERLNQQLIGWSGYFSKGYPRKEPPGYESVCPATAYQTPETSKSAPLSSTGNGKRETGNMVPAPLWEFRFDPIRADFSDSHDEKTRRQ